jgi:hypothetical protein
MKKAIFYLLYLINITAVILAFVHLVFFQNSVSTEEGRAILQIRLNLTLPILFLVIWSIVLWNRYDKKSLHLVLLILLPGLFTLYYSVVIIKKGWLDKENKFVNK